MKENILFLALDVDDKAYHGHGICLESGEIVQFKCDPDMEHLNKKIKPLSKKFDLRICHEISYLGFSLHRELVENGYFSEVIDPGKIPISRGARVKTDRLDSQRMAELYAKDLLTSVSIPDLENEMVRDLIRSRKFLVEQNKSLKNYILSMCRRVNINYRKETGLKAAKHFTYKHLMWLGKIIAGIEDSTIKTNFRLLLSQFEQNKQMIDIYDTEIEAIADNSAYKNKVEALICYKGIKKQTALTIISEIGDINRFEHPKRLMSYIGLSINEYSSGGKELKFGITKMGNKRVRTALVEACQTVHWKPQVSKWLSQRRRDVDSQYIQIADKCMKRLYKKSMRLNSREKHRNKVKVACARELTGFIWESLRLAS